MPSHNPGVSLAATGDTVLETSEAENTVLASFKRRLGERLGVTRFRLKLLRDEAPLAPGFDSCGWMELVEVERLGLVELVELGELVGLVSILEMFWLICC